MMYIDDCFRVILEVMEVLVEFFFMRIYNINVMSFILEELVQEVYKYILEFQIIYNVDFVRQVIGWYMVVNFFKMKIKFQFVL